MALGAALAAAPANDDGDDDENDGDDNVRLVKKGKRVRFLWRHRKVVNSRVTQPAVFYCRRAQVFPHDGSRARYVGQVSQPRCRSLSPFIGLKLLGFKDRSELAFEDNTKHSLFIYPDEMVSCSTMLHV